MIALSPARAPDQRGSASHVSRKPGDTCTCGAWAWSRWEDAPCSEIGRLAVKCFVDDNYTIPTICAGLVPGLAGRGGGGRRKWSSSGCVDISRVSWLSRTLQQCQHSAIAVPSLTPAKQPDNTFISLAAGGAARGRVVCSTQCPLHRPPPLCPPPAAVL